MSGAYDRHLESLVKDGEVDESIVDDSVRRVLRLKLRLGLFERAPLDTALAEKLILREDFRAIALEVAQTSMVLLKNEGHVLPLSSTASIALVGPLADNQADLLGCWAPLSRAEDVESVLDGFGEQRNGVAHVPGLDLAAAVAAAKVADVVVVVVGESANLSGEAHSRAHLGLPDGQQELVDALARTGKPIVGVLMTGRPLVVPRLAEQADALLVAWHGGIRAGRAVANVLFGTANPTGRLTASFPRAEGQIPVYYAHKNTGRPTEGAGTLQFDEPFKSRYLDEPNSPLFPFGFGLGYTTFEYTNLTVETPVIGVDGKLVVSARIENTGNCRGTEMVQLYVRDRVASVTRPVRELKAFQRISLEPGDGRSVRFEIPVSSLGFVGRDMRYSVEPGDFEVWIGPDSTRGLHGRFRVT